jgi:hypothetical protein
VENGESRIRQRGRLAIQPPTGDSLKGSARKGYGTAETRALKIPKDYRASIIVR